MLTMFTAMEAKATAQLITAEDYSIYQHIEVRIEDAVQSGGTSILYAGHINNNVLNALLALGYDITHLSFEGKERMIRISWGELKYPEEEEDENEAEKPR